MNYQNSPLRSALKDFWDDLTGRMTYHRYNEAKDRRRRVAGRLLFLANVVAASVYLIWFYSVINLSAWYFTFIFFFAEVSALVTIIVFSVILWHPRYHDSKGIPTKEAPTVDVFITTAGEPLDILEQTMMAATKIDYSAKKLYLLDDTASSPVQQLASKYDFHYLARNDRNDAKAGNLNYGIANTDGDLILALDADQICEPNIIKSLIGYFEFAYIGFVQTAQRFILPKGDPFGNSDELFYRSMLNGKDTDNAAFSCGSGVMYRRKALNDVGGFSTWNLVEDVHTSMKLHSKGWRSVYHNHPLSTGTAPTDILAVYKQRRQWATDSIRLLFWDSPFRQEGLSLKQKVQYFQVGFVYLMSAFIMPIYYIAPAWSMLTGNFIINAPAEEYLLYRGIYLIFTISTMVVMQYPIDSKKPFRIWAGLFPAFASATFAALRSRREKPLYIVNRKTQSKVGFREMSKAVLPQLSIMALIVVSCIYGIVFSTLPPFLLSINIAWGLWVIWVLSGIVFATFSQKEMPEQESSDLDADWSLST